MGDVTVVVSNTLSFPDTVDRIFFIRNRNGVSLMVKREIGSEVRGLTTINLTKKLNKDYLNNNDIGDDYKIIDETIDSVLSSLELHINLKHIDGTKQVSAVCNDGSVELCIEYDVTTDDFFGHVGIDINNIFITKVRI